MQLLTALLDDTVIFDGVTRRSIRRFAKERLGQPRGCGGEIHHSEVEDAAEEGRFLEAFTAGTAVYPASFPEK